MLIYLHIAHRCVCATMTELNNRDREWPIKAKIFILWPFVEKFAISWPITSSIYFFLFSFEHQSCISQILHWFYQVHLLFLCILVKKYIKHLHILREKSDEQMTDNCIVCHSWSKSSLSNSFDYSKFSISWPVTVLLPTIL